jgi:hypothetical protein
MIGALLQQHTPGRRASTGKDEVFWSSQTPIRGGLQMTSEEFREIEAALAQGHADMAEKLGISEVSVKRYATGSQPIPVHIARLMVALLVLSNGRQLKKFHEALARYQADT